MCDNIRMSLDTAGEHPSMKYHMAAVRLCCVAFFTALQLESTEYTPHHLVTSPHRHTAGQPVTSCHAQPLISCLVIMLQYVQVLQP